MEQNKQTSPLCFSECHAGQRHDSEPPPRREFRHKGLTSQRPALARPQPSQSRWRPCACCSRSFQDQQTMSLKERELSSGPSSRTGSVNFLFSFSSLRNAGPARDPLFFLLPPQSVLITQCQGHSLPLPLSSLPPSCTSSLLYLPQTCIQRLPGTFHPMFRGKVTWRLG